MKYIEGERSEREKRMRKNKWCNYIWRNKQSGQTVNKGRENKCNGNWENLKKIRMEI